MNDKVFLSHYGVPGMKWGVRRSITRSVDGIRKKLEKHKTKKIEKKSEQQLKTAIDGSIHNFVKANNYAADRINGKWINEFNKKWAPKFKDVDDWEKSPHYKSYVKAYSDNIVKLMNEKPTKVQLANGKTFVQEFLSENNDAAISWEWKEKK